MCACRLTRAEDCDFAEREDGLILFFDEEIASWRGFRVAVDGRVGAQRQSAGVVGAGRALVHHRGLSGPRGHVGQPNHEVAALGCCKKVIITELSFLLLDALPNARSMA